MKDSEEKALVQLRKLFKKKAAGQLHLSIVKRTIEESRETIKSAIFRNCFRGNNFERTFIAISPFVMQPMSCVAYIVSYSTYCFERVGFDTGQSFQLSVGGQVLAICGGIISWFFIDKYGIWFVMMYGLISLSILNFLVAV